MQIKEIREFSSGTSLRANVWLVDHLISTRKIHPSIYLYGLFITWRGFKCFLHILERIRHGCVSVRGFTHCCSWYTTNRKVRRKFARTCSVCKFHGFLLWLIKDFNRVVMNTMSRACSISQIAMCRQVLFGAPPLNISNSFHSCLTALLGHRHPRLTNHSVFLLYKLLVDDGVSSMLCH